MRWLVVALALVAAPALAVPPPQAPPPDLSALQQLLADTQVQAAAAVTAASAACTPMALVPPPETIGGSAGSGKGCRLATSVQPRITRTASCALASDGTCSTPWDTSSFPAGTVVRLTGSPAIVSSTATQPISCIATSVTVDAIGFKCWAAQSTVINPTNILGGLTLLPFISTGLAGSLVQVTAIPKS